MLRRRHLCLAACLLTCFPTLYMRGQGPGKRLGQLTRSVAPEEIAGSELRCENGSIAILDRSPNPRVLLYGSRGTTERTHDLALPDSLKTNATSVSISRQGVLAVAASALRSDGTTASLILLFDKPGSPSRVIRTDPFAAYRVALAPDGYLWAFGRDRDAESHGKDYPVFQKLTPDGRVIGQFVMRSTFPNTLYHPALHGGRRGGLCELRATRNGVGAYIPNEREWIELDNSGSIVGRWKPPAPWGASDGMVEAVAFTDSGSVYTHWLIGSRRVLCLLDRAAGVWEPVEGTDYQLGGPLPLPVLLLGSDGNQLVFQGTGRKLLWFEEPR